MFLALFFRTMAVYSVFIFSKNNLIVMLPTSHWMLTLLFYNIVTIFHIKHYNNFRSEHFTQALLQHTSYFIEHTNQSLSGSQQFSLSLRSGKSKYKDFCSKYFFLTSTTSAHQIMFDCDDNITCHTNRGLFFFFLIKDCVN